MSDSDLRPSCEHHHEEGDHDHHGHGPDRAQLRASRREFIKGVIASGVAVSSARYLVLGPGTAHAQAARALGRLVTLSVYGPGRAVGRLAHPTPCPTRRHKPWVY